MKITYYRLLSCLPTVSKKAIPEKDIAEPVTCPQCKKKWHQIPSTMKMPGCPKCLPREYAKYEETRHA
jgi:hypothetical protein